MPSDSGLFSANPNTGVALLFEEFEFDASGFSCLLDLLYDRCRFRNISLVRLDALSQDRLDSYSSASQWLTRLIKTVSPAP